jgi:peroxiredoxin
MKFLLWLFPACLAAQTATPDLLTGSWINEDRQNANVAQVVVRRDQNRTIVHGWGSCQPIYCDWGEADTELWNGIPMVIWKQGFSTTRMQLVPQPDGRLLLAYRSEYHDESGRTDAGHAEFFAREKAQTDTPETLAARALLHEVAETYRNLPSARFEWSETTNRFTGKSEIRSSYHVAMLWQPPDKVRIETSSSREPQVSIADGETNWTVYPQSGEYTRVPQGKGPLRGVPTYSLLDKARGAPKITGHEQLQGVDCTVIQIDLERGVTQRLWIETATHLVRRDSYEEPPTESSGVTAKRETNYTLARLGESFAPSVFQYDPAATHAKNRTQLAREASMSLQGQPAPDFTLHDLAGREVRLRDLRGKIVLLDFWGTWCGACREALPMIELLHRSLKDKNLVVLGVDSEAPELAREYLQRFGYNMSSLVDTKEEAVNQYRVQAWPTTVLIDGEGKVAYYEVGLEPEKLRDAIRALGVW